MIPLERWAGDIFQRLTAMVMILEVNFKGSGESLKSFMSLREMIFVIAIQRL